MDNSACAVLYLDRRVSTTGSLTRQALDRDGKDYLAGIGDEDAARNIHTLLVAFGEGTYTTHHPLQPVSAWSW